jgi:hypothetical protein
MKILSRLLFSMVNLGVAGWYLLAAAWVLGGFRVEVLTGASYEWPVRVVVTSTVVAVLGLLIGIAVLCITRGRRFGHVLVSALIALSLIEAWEFISLVRLYGVGSGSWLPFALLISWAAVCAGYLASRLRSDSSLKPNPLHGMA